MAKKLSKKEAQGIAKESAVVDVLISHSILVGGQYAEEVTPLIEKAFDIGVEYGRKHR